MNICGKCKNFRRVKDKSGKVVETYCGFNPPAAFMVLTQGLAGQPQPAIISGNPPVNSDREACGANFSPALTSMES